VSRRGHQPIRSCLGCGKRDFQVSLLRIALTPDGGVLRIDESRRALGRGGYLHRRPQCWAGFAARKGHVRSFRTAIDRPARVALSSELQRSVGL
jgi:predicted RNA-binding protein YlxR (DUF448 family)